MKMKTPNTYSWGIMKVVLRGVSSTKCLPPKQTNKRDLKLENLDMLKSLGDRMNKQQPETDRKR